MPLIVTVSMIVECLRTDCNILGDSKKSSDFRLKQRYNGQSSTAVFVATAACCCQKSTIIRLLIQVFKKDGKNIIYRAVHYILTCYDVLLTQTCTILFVVVAKYHLTAITFSPIRHGLPSDDVNYREASDEEFKLFRSLLCDLQSSQ